MTTQTASTSKTVSVEGCPLCSHSSSEPCNRDGGCVICAEAGVAPPETPTLKSASDSKWTCHLCGTIKVMKKTNDWLSANEPLDPNSKEATKWGCPNCGTIPNLDVSFMNRLNRTELRRDLRVKDEE